MRCRTTFALFADAAVSAAGAVTVHAFPMGSSPSVLGVITVYRRDSGPLAQGDADALFLADAPKKNWPRRHMPSGAQS